MRSGSREVVDALFDTGTFVDWSEPCADPADPDYLRAARKRTGLDEAVLVGEGRLDGRRIAVAISEFGFLGGSIGRRTADLIEDAVRRATREEIPVLAAPASGGTRMQEGTPAFVRMAGIAAAVARHRAAGHPYLVWLRDPTFGGVFASWGSLGQITFAEPGAALGFLGPRVTAALTGARLPAGTQTAENLVAHGVLDAVVPLDRLRERIADILAVLDPPAPRPGPVPGAGAVEGPAPVPDPWCSVVRSRRADRPGFADLLAAIDGPVVRLSGSGRGSPSLATRLVLTRLSGVPCVLVGQERTGQPIGPADLRVARRGFALAEELRLPLITVVDAAGGELSRSAEEGALAGEVASCLHDLARLTVPTVSLLLGEGGGGVALALAATGCVIASPHAWLAPLPPEGAAVIVHGDPGRAAELARAQHIDAPALLRAGFVDRVLPDDEPATALAALAAALTAAPGDPLVRPERS